MKNFYRLLSSRTTRLNAALSVCIGMATSAFSADWPTFLGPNGDFSSTISGIELISDLKLARQAWVSEESDMGKCKYSSSWSQGCCLGETHPGGGASPILYKGRVYVACFKPTGSDVDETIKNSITAAGGTFTPEYFAISADDMVVAIDAATGKTAWKKVFPGEGLNMSNGKRSHWCVTPVAAGGKLFAMSTLGKIRAFDAANGSVLWEGDNGAVGWMTKNKETCLLTKRKYDMGKLMDAAEVGLNLIGGVLLAPDYGSGIVGIDTATGSKLWTRTGIRYRSAIPTRYTAGGKDYVIVGNNSGVLRMIDPKTGVDVVKVENLAPLIMPLLTTDRHVYVLEKPFGNDGKWAAYSLSPGKAVRIWGLDKYRQICVVDQGARPKATFANGVAYIQIVPSGKIETATLIAVDDKSGEVTSTADIYGKGLVRMVEGRLMGSRDQYHGTPVTWSFYDPNPKKLAPMGSPWSTPVPTTTAYETPIVDAYGDGFLYNRTDFGSVVCYDLRAKGGTRSIRSPMSTQKSGGAAQAKGRRYDLRGRLSSLTTHNDPEVVALNGCARIRFAQERH